MAVSLHLVALVCPCLLLWRVTDGLGPRLTVFTDLHVDDAVVNSFLFDDAASSLTGCARQCSRHAGCLTFTFTEGLPGQGQCRGYSTKVNVTGHSDVTATPASKSYRKGTLLGESCASNSDCVHTMTACFSGQCLCKDGYFFSHSQYACVQTCAAFHPTSYLIYKHWDMLGHDVHNTQGVADVGVCRTTCSQDPLCRLIVVVWNRAACYYKYVTAQDDPAAWGPKALPDVYAKTCL